MRISLIENGLDSLKKGYSHLETYERLLGERAEDALRFSALKDSVLSIQHGIEILFKLALKENNELLLFTDITKLKQAFISRREGTINELYEADGVHTVTFKESIDRLKDICGFAMTDKFKKTLLKVEGWRNSITHSAVLLRENEVSRVLITLLSDLDNFFGPVIGAPYLEGQGRTDLDRAYRLTKAVYGELDNKIKAITVERLIHALQVNNIKNITAPDVFLISEPQKAHSILQLIQGDEITYGCDFINGHCSGRASIVEFSRDGILTMDTIDNHTKYQFKLAAIVVYIPKIQDDQSPLIFIYGQNTATQGNQPYLRKHNTCTLQHGITLDEDNTELWEAENFEQSNKDFGSDAPVLPPHQETIRFLSEGPICFMNVQQLDFGSAQHLLSKEHFPHPDDLYEAFKKDLQTP